MAGAANNVDFAMIVLARLPVRQNLLHQPVALDNQVRAAGVIIGMRDDGQKRVFSAVNLLPILVKLLKIAAQQDICQAELALAQLMSALRALEVEREMLLAQAQQQLRKDILPLEQIPLIAEAAAKVWQGANLSIYGETAPIVATIGPLVEVLTHALRLTQTQRVAEQSHN